MDKPFLFLCNLAYQARFRIPIIVSIFFLAFDVRLQIEISVQMRRIRRRTNQMEEDLDDSFSDDSWLTVEEETDSESDNVIAVR